MIEEDMFRPRSPQGTSLRSFFSLATGYKNSKKDEGVIEGEDLSRSQTVHLGYTRMGMDWDESMDILESWSLV